MKKCQETLCNLHSCRTSENVWTRLEQPVVALKLSVLCRVVALNEAFPSRLILLFYSLHVRIPVHEMF